MRRETPSKKKHELIKKIETIRVLVIDDNIKICEDLAKIILSEEFTNQLKKSLSGIQEINFKVDFAHDEQSGLDQINKITNANELYAFVFIDVSIQSAANEISLAKKIWDIDSKIEIVFSMDPNTISLNEIVPKLKRVDNLLFIKKPFDILEVRQLVGAMVQKWYATIHLVNLQEHLVEEKESQYRELLELSPFGVLIQSEEKICYVNQGMMKILGASDPKQLIGMSIFNIVHPDYHTIVKERLKILREEVTEVPLIEEKLIRLDGSIIPVRIIAGPIIYHNKPAAQVIVWDISHEKQTESALRTSRLLWEMIFSMSNDPIIIFDENYRIIAFNPYAERLYGYSHNELMKMSVYDLRAPEAKGSIATEMTLAKQLGNAKWNTIHITKDGKRLNVKVNIKTIQVDNRIQFVSFIRL